MRSQIKITGGLKIKTHHHLETIPQLPLHVENGETRYPEPHQTYINKAQQIIADETGGRDCFFWLVYFSRNCEFKIHDARSKNIFLGFSVEIERKIKNAIDFIRQEQLTE